MNGNTLSTSYSTCDAAKKVSAFEAELERLRTATQQQTFLLEELSSRLYPVMRPAPPQDSGAANQLTPVAESPLLEGFADRRRIFEGGNEVLRALIDRLTI